VAMPQPIVIITETPFISTPFHNIVGIRSRWQTLKKTELVNVQEEMPKKMNKVFVN
jgi:hypothetical protein